MSTTMDLLDGLIERSQEILADFPRLEGKKFNVYRYKVPERFDNGVQIKGQEETQDSVFPFVVVKPDTGSKKGNVSNQMTVVHFLFGVENDGHHGEGYDDVLMCIQHVWDALCEQPVVAKFFKLSNENYEWALSDDDAETHAYYYGLITVVFESPTMQYIGGYESGKRY